jgi:DNA polymerase-1
MKLLVDCSNLCYAAYFTTGQLSYEGQPTGIIYGFLRKLHTLARDLKPDGMIFCWDSRKSFRKQIFPDYKKHRQQKSPQDIEDLNEAFVQFNEIRKDVLPTLGFRNSFRAVGYEADDLIAYISMRLPDNYVIVSSDQDLYQLLYQGIHTSTKICNPSNGKIMDTDTFRKVYGIHPDQWAIAKSIGGCNSDEVPGIPGVGDPAKSNSSGAIRYLKGVLTKGKVFDAIESKEGQKIIKRNMLLVALPFGRDDIDLELTEDNLTYTAFQEMFEKYGFSSFKVQEWADHFSIEMNG